LEEWPPMSAQGHATTGDAAASHDHHYEGIPADRPGPDEPRTPLWLPLIGIGLVLFALLAYVTTRPAGKTAAELASEAAPSASVVVAAALPGSAQPGAAMPQRMRGLPGVASAFQPRPSGSALPMGRPRPAPPPGAPAGSPTVNPPHGAPGHVH
jgi:hypothetical protein